VIKISILSKNDIFKAIKDGEIKIDPYDENNVGPCSVDLHLSSKFSLFRTGVIVRPDTHNHTESIDTKGEPFFLSPGHFVLASTQEKIRINKKYAATLEGRSYVARMGVVVHAAGLVNPGTGLEHPTTLTLEIHSSMPVYLHPGMGIIQIIFHELKSEASVGYDERKGSKYIGLDEPRV